MKIGTLIFLLGLALVGLGASLVQWGNTAARTRELEAEVAGLEAQNRDLQQRLSEAQGTATALGEEVSSCELQNATIQQTLEEETSMKQDLLDQNRRMLDEIAELQDQVNNCQVVPPVPLPAELPASLPKDRVTANASLHQDPGQAPFVELDLLETIVVMLLLAACEAGTLILLGLTYGKSSKPLRRNKNWHR